MKWLGTFNRFFSKYFIIGFIFIILAFLIQWELIPELTKHPKLTYLANLGQWVIQTVGIALLVGSIFTFSMETNSFLKYVKEHLIKIIISKDFLRNLSDENKKEAMRLILRPTQDQEKTYSSVNSYFTEYAERSLNICKTNFKSSLTLVIDAFVDPSLQKIAMEHRISYRVHKGSSKYEPLVTGFEDEDSKIISTDIMVSGEPVVKVTEEDHEKTKQVEESGFEWYLFKYNIPEAFQTAEHISLNSTLIEYGEDHWQLFFYKTIVPSDGINVSLKCKDGLKVKDYMVFDIDKNYSITKHSNDSGIDIYCNQWLEPGAGFAILVAKPCS